MTTIGEVTEDAETFTLHEIFVCPSFARKLYPEQFDDCGLIIPGDRESECYGDDTVIPSQYWGTGEAGALAFFNDDVGGKPPFFENTSDDHFVVVVSVCILFVIIMLYLPNNFLCNRLQRTMTIAMAIRLSACHRQLCGLLQPSQWQPWPA